MLRAWFSMIAICSWIRGFIVQRGKKNWAWRLLRREFGGWTVISPTCPFTGHPARLLECSWLFSLSILSDFHSLLTQPSFSASSLLTSPSLSFLMCPLHFFFFLLESLLQTFLSFLPFGLHPLSLQLGGPQHLQTSKQSRGSCYHEIMRLSAPKLKEAIFCSCQLIIEGGRGTELFQYL